MRVPLRFLPLLTFVLAAPLSAQLPFYTDDPDVTDRGKFHFEFFNEFDALQHPQFPNLRQNTANFKLNYGLPYNLDVISCTLKELGENCQLIIKELFKLKSLSLTAK